MCNRSDDFSFTSLAFEATFTVFIMQNKSKVVFIWIVTVCQILEVDSCVLSG